MLRPSVFPRTLRSVTWFGMLVCDSAQESAVRKRQFSTHGEAPSGVALRKMCTNATRATALPCPRVIARSCVRNGHCGCLRVWREFGARGPRKLASNFGSWPRINIRMGESVNAQHIGHARADGYDKLHARTARGFGHIAVHIGRCGLRTSCVCRLWRSQRRKTRRPGTFGRPLFKRRASFFCPVRLRCRP